MSELLDLNRTSVNIDLSNQNLRSINARPILKALHHQHCLNHIDISNNFIQDEGLKYLTQALITMKNLSCLDLSGNGITETGIEYFCNTLDKSVTPTEIKHLKLNFNPIKSASLKHLSKLCRSKFITSMSLVACKLVDFDNEIETFNGVKELNISYNHFTFNGLKNIFRKLNSTLMESINLDRCSIELNIGDIIVKFITSGCYSTLREVHLSGLKLTENEILDILRCLQSCGNLKVLNLSYQNDLTFLTMKFILFNMGNDNLRVNLVGCHNIYKTFDIKYNHDQLMSSYPCHIQFSLPKVTTIDVRNEFITKMRDLWMNVTDSRGTIHQDKNILHLLGENRNANEFL